MHPFQDTSSLFCDSPSHQPPLTMSQYYGAFSKKLDSMLQEKNRATDILNKLQKSTGIKKLYIAQGLLGVFALYMIIGHFAELICNFVGFIYPAYCSIHALESPHKQDDAKWLTYWVVYALFATVEFFSNIIFRWFPLYWLVKISFLIWCFLPISSNGSMVIYHKFIRPFFLKNHGAIDGTIGSAGDALLSGASKLVQDKSD